MRNRYPWTLLVLSCLLAAARPASAGEAMTQLRSAAAGGEAARTASSPEQGAADAGRGFQDDSGIDANVFRIAGEHPLVQPVTAGKPRYDLTVGRQVVMAEDRNPVTDDGKLTDEGGGFFSGKLLWAGGGAVAGALAGWFLGGPFGALIGAALGAIAGWYLSK